jgi:2-hydroxy-6-oxonona-2,4-dienedioate hydrolase/4,5:9,10-diseco-3-hydroxy-5,9,17-trioxoandrosta-1(10),2-diene-4-oate hydrolase
MSSVTEIAANSVELEGGRICYLEAGAGSTMVYLHGAGGRPPAGATFVSELARDFRVLVPSRPGFDGSSEVEDRTQQGAARAVAGFIERTAQGPVHVVAQSAGGAIGMWLAVDRPDLVASLVLSAPSAFAHRASGGGGGGPRSPEALDKLLYGDNPTWITPPGEDDQARIRRNAAYNMQHFNATDESLRDRLSEIKSPVLVLWGTEDRLVPSEGSGMYQQRMPQALRLFIHGAAHELPISATRQWCSLVRDFLQRGEFFVVNRGATHSE